MSKLFNTLLLSTALICCSNSYSLDANGHYNILYDSITNGLNTFLFGDKCEVATNDGTVDSSSDYQLGQLYYNKEGWQPLKDEEGRPFFDLATVVNNQSNAVIKDFISKGAWNLIIKKDDSELGFMPSDGIIRLNTYTLNNNDLEFLVVI